MQTEQLSLNEKNVSRQIKKETEDFIESNENEYRAYQNLWNTMRAVLRGKFIALCVYIKKTQSDLILIT